MRIIRLNLLTLLIFLFFGHLASGDQSPKTCKELGYNFETRFHSVVKKDGKWVGKITFNSLPKDWRINGTEFQTLFIEPTSASSNQIKTESIIKLISSRKGRPPSVKIYQIEDQPYKNRYRVLDFTFYEILTHEISSGASSIRLELLGKPESAPICNEVIKLD